MSIQVESPEKMKTKSLSSTPSFSLLPDDITINYLARIPRPYYPRLSTVCKNFRSTLSSSEIYKARYNLGTTEHCLYVSIRESNRFPHWFRLWINPNETLTVDYFEKKKTGNVLVPILPVNILNSGIAWKSIGSDTACGVVVDSEIYVIARELDGVPSSVVRILDCRTHIWRDAPSMNVARKFPASCFSDGKIYVLGGCKEDDEPWAEVFDLKTLNWECLPDPGGEIRKSRFSRIVEIKGKIKFISNIRNEPKTMYAYDPKQGQWEHCGNASEMLISSECMIENVSYSCRDDYYDYFDPFSIRWYDITVGTWKRVKGVVVFQEKHCKGNIGSSRLVSCGGKLLLVWEMYMRNERKICCTQIKVEKCDEGEVWGKIEWDDVVLTIPTSCDLLHCHSVLV